MKKFRRNQRYNKSKKLTFNNNNNNNSNKNNKVLKKVEYVCIYWGPERTSFICSLK